MASPKTTPRFFNALTPRLVVLCAAGLVVAALGLSRIQSGTPASNGAPAPLEVQQLPGLERLRLEGRRGLVNDAGRPVPWTAVTGFRLVEQVAQGRAGEAAAFLSSLGPARGVRVLLMARWLFQLSPDDGLAALAATLDLARQHGRYLEVTIFADTRSFPLSDADYRRIADRVGAICAAHTACALVELANEVWPLHDTQADVLGNLAFLRSLRDTVRAHGDIPVSLGSSHASQDGSDRMRDGDYLTVHGAREDGDNGWRWVRRLDAQRELADRVGKYAVNDEPKRDDLDCGRQFGAAVLARLFHLGDTFHYAGGLQAQPPSGPEARAYACRSRGWEAVSHGWRGERVPAGALGSPVRSIVGAVSADASVTGQGGYVAVLGVTPQARITWNEGWTRDLIVDESGAQLYRVSR